MQLKTVTAVLGGGAALLFVVIWSLKSTNHDTVNNSEISKNLQQTGDNSCLSPDNSWKPYELLDFYNSVAVIYDYSTITPEQLRADIKAILSHLNGDLVLQLLLLENLCENKLTSAEAVRLAKTHSNVRIVLVDADEVVTSGRARIEAVKKTTAPFLLFLSAGSVPDSKDFLETLLYAVNQSPESVVSPARKAPYDAVGHLTWSLNVKKEDSSARVSENGPVQLPLVDNSAFLIRADMYKAVGGYDSFFFKSDSSDRIAFSLSVWLCGGSIVRSDCTLVRSKASLYKNDEEKAVKYLQHAKYIQEVFGGSFKDHFTSPGVEFYKSSPYDKQAIESRRNFYASRGCMTIEWYAQKFSANLPVKYSPPRLYNPNYKPVLPLFEPTLPQKGKLFVLLAGQCVRMDDDFVLGLGWCPKILDDTHTFLWKDNGQIHVKQKCVTVRAADLTLAAEECKEAIDNSQIFTYDKTSHQIIAKHDGQCVTHMNGPKGRQVLQSNPCGDNSPFVKFIINDDY